MNAEIPFAPFDLSVTAMITSVSAEVPCVMNIFDPFNTQHVAVLDRRRAHRRRIAARARFGESPRRKLRALRERDQVFLLLCVVREHRDVRRAETVVRGNRQGHARIDAGELFDADAVIDGAHAGAAVLVGKLDAHQAELGELGHQLFGEMLSLVPLHHVGTNFSFREFPNALAKELLLVGQRKVHSSNRYTTTLKLPELSVSTSSLTPRYKRPLERIRTGACIVADEEHVVADLADQRGGVAVAHRAVRIGRRIALTAGTVLAVLAPSDAALRFEINRLADAHVDAAVGPR